MPADGSKVSAGEMELSPGTLAEKEPLNPGIDPFLDSTKKSTVLTPNYLLLVENGESHPIQVIQSFISSATKSEPSGIIFSLILHLNKESYWITSFSFNSSKDVLP